MSGLPTIHVTGTIVADPELKFTPSGAAVANFTVAANERRKDPNTGEWSDGAATFLRCNIWRQAAENVAESLHRGDRVIVTGRLKQREYEKDGQKRSVFEMEVDEIGPSLKWAQAKVSKLSRSEGDTSGGSADPWGSSPTSPSTDDSEPPF